MRNIDIKLQNKIIILSGIILLIVIIVLSSVKLSKKDDQPQPNKNNPQVQTKQEEVKPETFSRISVFNTMPIKLSIAIPSSWEGRYRTKEAGDTAYIIYIKNPDMPTNIIQFGYYIKGANIKENEKVIFSDKDTTITYKKVVSNPYQGETGADFDNILKRLDSIIKEINIIK